MAIAGEVRILFPNTVNRRTAEQGTAECRSEQ